MVLVNGAAFGSGLALGTASILSVGPNNLMMVREGLRRGRTWLVGSLVWGSYLVLLLSACTLAEPITQHLLWCRHALSWLGIGAMTWFAIQSLRAAFGAGPVRHAADATRETWGACLRRVMTVIWCNPLTYVELLLIPAAMSGSFPTSSLREQFLLGLVIMATACCSGYSLGGGFCATLLRHRRTLQAFDLLSGLILAAVALTMTASVATGRWL